MKVFTLRHFRFSGLCLGVAGVIFFFLPNSYAGGVPEKKLFTLQCQGVSFSTCMDDFTAASGLRVSYAKGLGAVNVSSSISSKDPVDALRKLLETVGDGNHAVSFDATNKLVTINSFGVSDEGGAAQTMQGATPKKLFPNADDIRAANKSPNPDAEMAPGKTYREIQQASERLELQKPDPNAPFFPSVNGDKAITWGELQKRQQEIDKGKPTEYTLPDGSKVSVQKLKEQQAIIDKLHPAKVGQGGSSQAASPVPSKVP